MLKEELKAIRYDIVPYTRGKGLEISKMHRAFPHFTWCWTEVIDGVRPDVLIDATEKLDQFASHSQDFIFSLETPKKEWCRLVKPGGYIVVKEEFEHPNGWDLVEKSSVVVYKRLKSDKNRQTYKDAKPVKTAAVVRYGAFGDLMQASSVIAGLKQQGYHVTLYSTPPGSDVVLHDPNIDQFIYQDKDQVPNHELHEFWKHLKTKYDKFVNLSESVEAIWLAMPDRGNHKWSHEVRHKYLNKNYLEFQHDLAGVPHKSQVRFYATDEEKQWARKERNKMGKFVILWSLSGSAQHKVWPYLDSMIAALMLNYSDVDVVLCGGPECEMLEAGWDKEKRVHRTSGKWTIRQSLSFIDVADMVIGPETGVLNAASCLKVPKIVTLSHSSDENLTRDWVNCQALAPKNTSCYPCHMLHFGWEHCHQDKDDLCPDCTDNEKTFGHRSCKMHTGVAKCQADISGDQMWDAISRVVDEFYRKAA